MVGPNGCGKSNLLEAIRWAMGESSPKSLRGGGMDDVIFAGTATRPPRDFAEVSILLERDGRRGRRAAKARSRGGSSAAPARPIASTAATCAQRMSSLLFADAATGAHSPALVSQGKIGAIIAAKPVERRLLLEEAAGISGLHARRKDAEQKLRAAEANLARLGEILGDQEQRAAQLRRQARAAERYRKLTDQIRAVEARLLHARWVEAERAAEAATAEAQAAAEEVERIHQAIAEAQAAHDRATQALAERRNALARCASKATPLPTSSRRPRAPRHDCAAAGRARPPRCFADRRHRARGSAQGRRGPRDRVARRGRGGDRRGSRIRRAHSARIAAELSAAEAVSREAEAALAELLARQAAMRAERRVAEAALDAAWAQQARTSQERTSLPNSCGARRRQRTGAARDDAEANAKSAGEALAKAEAARVEAEEGRARGRRPRAIQPRAVGIGARGPFRRPVRT